MDNILSTDKFFDFKYNSISTLQGNLASITVFNVIDTCLSYRDSVESRLLIQNH